MTDDGFYEDDEPIEEIEAAFNRGVKGYTQPPAGKVWSYSSLTWTLATTYTQTWPPRT